MSKIKKFVKHWGRGIVIIFDDDDKILLNSISIKDMERIALKLEIPIEDRKI